MSDILQRIVAVKREEVAAAQARRGLASLRRDAEARTDRRSFEAALRERLRAGRPARQSTTPNRSSRAYSTRDTKRSKHSAWLYSWLPKRWT